MDISHALTFIALGALVGAAGQGVRAIVGLKKEIVEARKAGTAVAAWFDGREMFVSFLLGAVAGILAAVLEYGPDRTIGRELLLIFLGAGYAGADFIGGLMEKWIP